MCSLAAELQYWLLLHRAARRARRWRRGYLRVVATAATASSGLGGRRCLPVEPWRAEEGCCCVHDAGVSEWVYGLQYFGMFETYERPAADAGEARRGMSGRCSDRVLASIPWLRGQINTMHY